MKIYQNGKLSTEFEHLTVHNKASGGWFEKLIGINIDWVSRVPSISPIYAPLFYTEQHPGQTVIILQLWSLKGVIISLEERWPFIRIMLTDSYILEKTDERDM